MREGGGEATVPKGSFVPGDRVGADCFGDNLPNILGLVDGAFEYEGDGGKKT